jgi:hypothetical protein
MHGNCRLSRGAIETAICPASPSALGAYMKAVDHIPAEIVTASSVGAPASSCSCAHVFLAATLRLTTGAAAEARRRSYAGQRGRRFSRFNSQSTILTVKAGGLPWVSLTLAGSFGLYGFFRKTLPIGPTQGFMLEVMLLSVPAIAIIGWLSLHGASHFGPTGAGDIGLLLLAGPVTAFPLILYAFGAKALRYTTIGIVQYITPTMIFLAAVFAFGEPFSHWQLIAFIFIWSALALYTLSLFRR